MDGYEYERKVLFPMWNKESQMIESHNASTNKSMRERLKDELGLVIPKDPVETQLSLNKKIVKNPDNFFPELSPDYEFIMSGKRNKWS